VLIGGSAFLWLCQFFDHLRQVLTGKERLCEDDQKDLGLEVVNGLTVGGSFRKTITRALRHLWNHYLGLFSR
jgi:hypothetical protein